MHASDHGFTLIEVLIAMMLLSFVLLGVAPMFLTAIQGTAAGADMGTVGALAVDRMEQLRGQRVWTLNPGGSLTSDVTVNGTPYFDLSTDGYIVRWQISAGATGQGGRRIAVRALATREVAGQAKEVVLTSIRGTS